MNKFEQWKKEIIDWYTNPVVIIANIVGVLVIIFIFPKIL